MLTKELRSQRTRDYQRWVEAFAANHQIPMPWAEKGVRKEDSVRRILQRRQAQNRCGVYYLFRSGQEFYSVLFHELTHHATGHGSRLNRKGISGASGELSAFGSAPYAKEELVAEMGAAFLCGQAGIVERTIDNSAAYIASWLERLRNDRRLVVQAAAQAQKAADFILDRHFTEEPEVEQ